MKIIWQLMMNIKKFTPHWKPTLLSSKTRRSRCSTQLLFQILEHAAFLFNLSCSPKSTDSTVLPIPTSLHLLITIILSKLVSRTWDPRAWGIKYPYLKRVSLSLSSQESTEYAKREKIVKQATFFWIFFMLILTQSQWHSRCTQQTTKLAWVKDVAMT